MIDLMLPMRATVRRSIADYSSGSPTYVWQEIAKNVPCLFARRGWQDQHADVEPTKSKAHGTLYFGPDADIKPADSVVIPNIGTFSVGTDGGLQNDYLGEPHHIEFSARQTA